MVVLEGDVALHTCVGYIEVVGLCRILCSQGVYLLHYRKDAIVLAKAADGKTGLSHVAQLLFKTHGTRNLEIGKSIDLGGTQEFLVQSIDVALLHRLVDIDDVLQFLEEPLVNLGEFMNLVNSISLVHGLGNHEHTLICWLLQGCIDIINLKLLVLYEAVHALTYHTKTLLNGLLEVAADGHHLTYRLHR